ncbi:hypothetical protein GCM10022396_06530 [Flavivirga amylovorans]
MKKQAGKIRSLTSKLNKNTDLYKLRLIDYRFGVELDKYNYMSNGEYKQFCLNSRMYFMYIFRSALDILRSGDIYRTVTTIDIWLNDKKDSELIKNFPGVPKKYRKSFLLTNLQAARRKVSIERYFVVDEELMQDKTSMYYANLKTLVQRFVDALDEDSSSCEIYFCPSKNYKVETSDNIPFALIRNEARDTFMYLKSDISNPKLPYVQMNFLSDREEEVYLELYEKLKSYRKRSADRKIELDRMAAILGVKKS